LAAGWGVPLRPVLIRKEGGKTMDSKNLLWMLVGVAVGTFFVSKYVGK
jgi:hypothetical protein